MRILIAGCTYSPALNGQAVFMVHLAEGLAAQGHDVTVLYPENRTSSSWRNGVRLEAVRSLELSPVRAEAYFPYLFGRRVREVFDSVHPEVLHINDHYPVSIAAASQARQRGIRVVGTTHFVPANVEPYIPGSRFMRPLLDRILWYWMLRLYRHLDYVTAPSQAAIDMLKARGLRLPMRPVSCGTDLERFHPDPSVDRAGLRRAYGLDPNRKLFLYVGRNDREKRIDVLLRAVQQLQRDDIQLAVAGDGAAHNALKHLARDLQLGDRARFLGRVPNEDLNALLNSADAFALASEAELLSIASLEAMASGRPVLLADAGALPELVVPGVNGYLFKPGDPGDAARYMALLADDPALRERMGRASLERVQSHSLDLTVQTYATLYQQVLQGIPFVQSRVGQAGLAPRPVQPLAPSSGKAATAVRRAGEVKRQS